MTNFEASKAEHQRLLAQHDAGGDPTTLESAAHDYIEQVRVQSENIADPRDRDQLRAYLRFWAAFLYDQTGTYPETSLRPASEAAKRTRIRWDWRWIAAGAAVIFVVFVLLAVLGPMVGGVFSEISSNLGPPPKEPKVTVSASATDELNNPDVGEKITFTPDQEPSAASPTHTLTPSATATHILALSTDTPFPAEATSDPRTATLSALMTEVAAATVTPTPFSALPDTGGGDEIAYFIREQLMLVAGNDSEIAECTARYVDVNLAGANTDLEKDATIKVELNRQGETQVTRPAEILSSQKPTTLDLGGLNSSGETSYLLHVDHPLYTTSDVIIQFSPNCSTERLMLSYDLTEDWSYLEKEPGRNPDLGLTWNLVTWGPEPLDFRETVRWFAVLDLVGQGGDGNYVFWQADETGKLAPMDGNRVIVRGFACWPGRLLVGLTSAGLAVTREILLQVPYCPAGAPAPTP